MAVNLGEPTGKQRRFSIISPRSPCKRSSLFGDPSLHQLYGRLKSVTWMAHVPRSTFSTDRSLLVSSESLFPLRHWRYGFHPWAIRHDGLSKLVHLYITLTAYLPNLTWILLLLLGVAVDPESKEKNHRLLQRLASATAEAQKGL